MPKMIQIRNVSDDVHRTIKERAARAGMTMSDYLKRDLERQARNPVMEEFGRAIREQDEPTDLSAETILAAIHEGRSNR
jgi:plasmid stability protein